MVAVLSVASAVLLIVAVLLLVALASMHRRHHPRFELPPRARVTSDVASLAGLAHGATCSGNRVALVEDEGYLPACLSLIESAEHTLHFETFLWRTGTMSARIADALGERARRGVEVRLLLDSFGSNEADERELEAMRAAGAEVHMMRPIRFRYLGWLNNRTHRKIIVADGRRALVGGHCVDDRWLRGFDDKPVVRDISARVEGPIVNGIQAAFCENWIEVSGQVPYGPDVFPPLEPRGHVCAYLAYVRPSGGVSSVKLLHYLMLNIAKSRLWIQTPYFVPDDFARDALIDAAARGVDVRVLVPALEATDNRLVAHASQHRLVPLLERGVRVYRYHRTLLHQKVWTIDGEHALIGSVNFDERSFDLDDQITLAVADRSLTRAIDERFVAELAHATEVDPERWRSRPRTQKLSDALAYVLREQL